MNLDLLDKTYPMMKSKSYFVDFDNTDLTSGTHRSDQSDQTCQFWVRTCAPIFCGKTCVSRNIHKDQTWMKTMINNVSPICKLYMDAILTEMKT
jgi:hypothetical protein